MSKKLRLNIAGWALMFPFIFFFSAFLVYPSLYTVVHSFTDSPLIGWGNWIGFENYVKLFKDKLFAKSIINTFIFVGWTVIPNTIIGLIIAIMINRIKSPMYAAMVLACFFLPHILPVTVLFELFVSLTRKESGSIQWVVNFFGYESIPFFKHKLWAMPAVSIVIPKSSYFDCINPVDKMRVGDK